MSDPKPSSRIHPLVATAAVACTVLSLTSVAAITGLIPSSNSTTPAQITQTNDAQDRANQAQQEAYPKASLGNQQKNSAQYAQASRYDQQQPAPHATRPQPIYDEPQTARQERPPAQATCQSCGRVESIQAVQHAAPSSVGVGTATGALLGGVLGHQIGNGNGNTLATIAGAVGGGFAGTEVERRARSTTTYQVHVRMENGKMRSFPQSAQQWQAGDAVRVVNGHLEGRG